MCPTKIFLILVLFTIQTSYCSSNFQENEDDLSKERDNVLTDVALRVQNGESRGCPNCVGGECATNTIVSGLPIVQLIAAGIVGFIWAAIFIWLYASFYSTSYNGGGGYGYGYSPSPSYGYGMSPSPSYGTPDNQYGAPPVGVYSAPAPAPLYSAPGPSYQAPAPAYQAPAPVYQAPAPAPVYQAPAPVYQAPAPVYGAPAPASAYMAPASAPSSSQQFNAVDLSTMLKPPSRSSFNSRSLDTLTENVESSLNSTKYR